MNLAAESRRNDAPALHALSSSWRERAADLRRWAAAEGAAVALEQAANDLDAALQSHGENVLTLQQAEAVSGYSVDHIGRLVRNGTLRNVGRRGAPRVLRSELPMKPSAMRSAALPGGMAASDIPRAEIARAVVHRHVGGE